MNIETVKPAARVGVRLEGDLKVWEARVVEVNAQRQPRSVKVRLTSLHHDLWVSPDEILQEVP